MKRNIIFILIITPLLNCSGHSTISPKTLKKGQSYQAITYSFDSMVPIYTYRKGISNKTDLGISLGFPIYGSGINMTRLLNKNGRKSTLLNVGFSYALNSSFDFTLFNTNNVRRGVITYYGTRLLLIPNGISGNKSLRFGLLLGNYTIGKMGFEFGYFHDFSSMPITKVFSSEYIPEGGYKDFPHMINGIPSEYSRMAGISIRVSFPLNEKKVQKNKKKNK